MTLANFAEKNHQLFWSTKNYSNLSKAAVVEGVLNFGDMSDVKELCKLLGIKEVSNIFSKQIKGKRVNYRPEVVNYFQLYFKKYA